MKARISRSTVFGGVKEERAAIRWREARIEPREHIQPRMVVETGEIMVFLAERRRSHLSRAARTFLQLNRSSVGVLPPQ